MNSFSMSSVRCFLLIAVLAFAGYSCKYKSTGYEEYKPVNPMGWLQDSVAVFKYEVKDPKALHNLSINIRNSGDYAYSNIWLFVDIVAPDRTTVKDTVEFQLSMPNGKWIGEGTSGLYSCQFPYRNNVFFPVAGTYTFKIEHGMRDDILKGISDVGIKIDKR